MKIELLLLGKTKEDYLAAGIEDYSRRLHRYVPVELKYLRTKTHHAQSDDEIKGHESRLLNDYLMPGSFRVALDSSGKHYTSEELAELLTNLELRGVKQMSCIIGGHLGLAPEQLEAADLVLSLSQLTFTHEMSRLILLEQLYRAYTIKAGTKYHK